MISLIRNKDFYGIALYLMLFVLVCYQKMISPAIAVFVIVFLVEALFLKKISFKFSPQLILLAGLFVFYLIGISWAEHKDVGFKLLEYKLSFIIFPVLFLFRKKSTQFWNVIEGFIIGTIILSVGIHLVSFSSGVSQHIVTSDQFGLHPTYSTIYLTVACFILIYGKLKGCITWNKYVVLLISLLYLSLILSMISFAGILFLILFLGFLLLRLIYKRFGKLAVIGSIIIMPILVVVAVANTPQLAYDYEMTTKVLSQLINEPDKFISSNTEATSGTQIRTLVWYSSAQVIAENPLGVGLGDIDYYLKENFDRNKFSYLQGHDLNPHNQYLQIGIDLGILGMLYLIFVIIILIRYGVKHKNYILVFLVSCMAFNGLFESVLQKQNGIVFFSLMISVLLVFKEINQNTPTEN